MQILARAVTRTSHSTSRKSASRPTSKAKVHAECNAEQCLGYCKQTFRTSEQHIRCASIKRRRQLAGAVPQPSSPQVLEWQAQCVACQSPGRALAPASLRRRAMGSWRSAVPANMMDMDGGWRWRCVSRRQGGSIVKCAFART
eukprot:scaffold264446_cov33-Tisochrysis_lutea.AAC.7